MKEFITLMKEFISSMKAFISLMKELIIPMKESNSSMKECIPTMKESYVGKVEINVFWSLQKEKPLIFYLYLIRNQRLIFGEYGSY